MLAAGAQIAVVAGDPNMNHFDYTAHERTIVLYGQGPVELKYVNPSDDPRTRR